MFMSHLHNFCVNMESSDLTSKQEINEIIPAEVSILGCGYPSTVVALLPNGSVHGSSHVHDAILYIVFQIGVRRPVQNIQRK